MKKLFTIAACISMILAANPASGGPIHPRDLDPDNLAWFYNRPGATPEQVTADATECAAFGRRLFGPPTANPDAAMTGVVPAIMLGIVTAGPVVAYTDDCMMAKSYRRFNVAGTTQRRFSERVTTLPTEMQAALAGADTPPEGALARQWANTYWIAADGDATIAPLRERAHRSAAPQFLTRDAKLFVEPLAEGAGVAPGLNDAVFVMTFRSMGRDQGKIYFARDLYSGEPDPIRVGRHDRWPTLVADAARRQANASGVVRLVFVAPAGTYALSAVGQGYYIRSTFFCYETIAFTARAGEVVHLGAYTVETEPSVTHPLAPIPRQRLRIDLPSLEGARADLAQSPDLAARMTLAAYVNNFPHACPETVGIAAYGLDMPGATSLRAEPAPP